MSYQVVWGDLQQFSIRYLQLCEGERPDVSIVDLSMASYPWFVLSLFTFVSQGMLLLCCIWYRASFSIRCILNLKHWIIGVSLVIPSCARWCLIRNVHFMCTTRLHMMHFDVSTVSSSYCFCETWTIAWIQHNEILDIDWYWSINWIWASACSMNGCTVAIRIRNWAGVGSFCSEMFKVWITCFNATLLLLTLI